MHVIYCSYCTIRKKAQLALFCTLRAYFVETLKHNKIYSLNRPDMQKTPDFLSDVFKWCTAKYLAAAALKTMQQLFN